MLESRAERSALGAAPDVADRRRWLEFSESKNLTAESHEQKKERPEHHLRTRSLFRFCTQVESFIFATRPKCEARNRIRIIISLRNCM